MRTQKSNYRYPSYFILADMKNNTFTRSRVTERSMADSAQEQAHIPEEVGEERGISILDNGNPISQDTLETGALSAVTFGDYDANGTTEQLQRRKINKHDVGQIFQM